MRFCHATPGAYSCQTNGETTVGFKNVSGHSEDRKTWFLSNEPNHGDGYSPNCEGGGSAFFDLSAATAAFCNAEAGTRPLANIWQTIFEARWCVDSRPTFSGGSCGPNGEQGGRGFYKYSKYGLGNSQGS